MSDDDQPTLEYFFETLSPGVPAGTMMAEICVRPLTGSPVTAATVTTPVMLVPEFVMKALVPLITQSPPSRRAVVRTAPASEPPPGSVNPKAARSSPAAQAGQPALFLLLGPETVERRGPERYAR